MHLQPISNARVLRRWALVARPNTGKSSFLARLALPMLVIDADGRFAESSYLSGAEERIFALPNIHESGLDVKVIDEELTKAFQSVRNTPMRFKTIAVDSLTGILSLINQRGLAEISAAADEGRRINKNAPHAERANKMELLQTSVGAWGTDVVWVWHERDYSMDGSAQVRDSIPKSEIPRLLKMLNARLEVVVQDGRHGIRIAWSRSQFRPGFEGIANKVLWDTEENYNSGDFWAGMPERIDAVLATGKDPAETPMFNSRDDALAWAVTSKGFSKEDAEALYAKVKAERSPKKHTDMFAFFAQAVEEAAAAAQTGKAT